VRGKGQSVNVFFRNKQHDLVAAITQYLGDSDSGEKMSTGSSARDHCIHEHNPPAAVSAELWATRPAGTEHIRAALRRAKRLQMGLMECVFISKSAV
jgi:hypothetical protein